MLLDLTPCHSLNRNEGRGKRQGLTPCTQRLQGRNDYRLRIGDYRVIFEIDQSGIPIILTITQVEKRNERTY